jgi:hypothetical protein
VIEPSSLMVKEVAAVKPKRTAVAPDKLLPWIVIESTPEANPLAAHRPLI